MELCLCASRPQVDLGFPVSVLQHNGERGKPTSTGKFVPQLFHGSSIHRYGVRHVPFDPSPYEGGSDYALLYPSDESTPLADSSLMIDDIQTGGLLLLDGTWAQASHMRQRLPCIQRLKCFHIVPTETAIWRLRRTRKAHHRCTLETALIAAEIVCGRQKIEPLWEFFYKLTASLLFMRGDLPSPEPPQSWRLDKETGQSAIPLLVLGALTGLLILMFGCTDSDERVSRQDKPSPKYVGSETCRPCHEQAHSMWSADHHALAESDFDEATHGPAFASQVELQGGGETTRLLRRNERATIERVLSDKSSDIRQPVRVIGVAPIWQLLVPGERGRLQATAAAYDVEAHEWFDVFGNDGRTASEWGHWTKRGMSWNSMCATCHVTAFQKNYSPDEDVYGSTYSEARVGCEACHGPMSLHVDAMAGRAPELAVQRGAFWTPPAELKRRAGNPGSWTPPQETISDDTDSACAMCHARRVEVAVGFAAGQPFLDYFSLVLPDATETFFPDGQINEEDYEYTSFISSRMHAAGVRCNHCHEPHGSGLRLQGNAMCLSCHGETIDPQTHAHHELGGAGSNCVDCHMPTTVYMQRDPRHDHSFSIPTPELTIEMGIPNACNRCHKEKDASWSKKTLDEWFPKRTPREALLRARAIHAVREQESGSHRLVAKALQQELIPFWRAALTGVLGRTDDPIAAIPLLREGMQSDDALRRWAAAQNAGELLNEAGDENSLRMGLRGLLDDPVRSVRIAAAWALRRTLDEDHSSALELMAFLELNADQPAGAMQLGSWYFDRSNGSQGELRKALEWLEKAAAWDAGSAVALHGCAVAKSALGDSRGARKLLERAVSLQSDNAPWLYALALAVHEDGDLPRAERLLSKVCRLNPDYLRAHYNLGLARVALGRVDEGLAALGEAIRRAPRDLEFHMARVAILRDAGRHLEALARMKEAVAIAPENRELLGALRELYLATGDRRRAAAIEDRLRRTP